MKNTQQITRAMKMVAAAKLRRAQDRAIASRPYARLLLEVLASVSARVVEPKHPLLASREEKRVILMIVAGDRGLAGAFNANVHRTVLALLAEKRGWESVTILPIGKKALDDALRNKLHGMIKEFKQRFVAEQPAVSAHA